MARGRERSISRSVYAVPFTGSLVIRAKGPTRRTAPTDGSVRGGVRDLSRASWSSLRTSPTARSTWWADAPPGDAVHLSSISPAEITDTTLTVLIAAPTGANDAKFRTIPLTQEKQLGLGRINGSVTLDHTLDKTWGLIVLGGSFGYRGGQNEFGNYRAPAAAVYGYTGYFAGAWVPSLGLSLSHFFGADRDRGLDQEVQLWAVTGTLAVEWANDDVAILGGVSLPFGWDKRGVVDGAASGTADAGLQPWTAGIGITLSPF